MQPDLHPLAGRRTDGLAANGSRQNESKKNRQELGRTATSTPKKKAIEDLVTIQMTLADWPIGPCAVAAPRRL
jgi:hypothetical protein